MGSLIIGILLRNICSICVQLGNYSLVIPLQEQLVVIRSRMSCYDLQDNYALVHKNSR